MKIIKTISIVAIFILINGNSHAADSFIHFAEGLTVEEAQNLFKKIDKSKIKTAVEYSFKDIKNHPAKTYVEMLEFNSFTSGKKRPVFKVVFETVDGWEKEEEFCKFLTRQYKAQIDAEYLHE